MAVKTLPSDIVAIDCAARSFLFYVNSKNKLCYLLSPTSLGDDDFISKIIELSDEDVVVHPENRQVAAITWESYGTYEIRVYFVKPLLDANNRGVLNEVCLSIPKSGNFPDPRSFEWFQGSLGLSGKTLHDVEKPSSISATIYKYRDPKDNRDKWSLRVFASGLGQQNKFENPVISVYKFEYDEAGNTKGNWGSSYITNEIRSW